MWVARLRGKHGFEKLFAIKTILPQYANDARFQRMFLDEARIASRIEHVNVAQILDLGDERDVLYIVMEWVDGDALSKLHRAAEKAGGLLPHGIALRVLADACGGLHAAHELRDKDGELLGVVHRDVSPQNVLVGANGVAKVIDFGIAKARDRIAGETSTGALKGKVQYMAPEQALGRPVDRRADVWAVGAMLYYFLSGKPPYEADNQLATLHLLTKGDPPAPLPPAVPAAIAAVVAKAIAADPDARYATAADLQRAIERAMTEAGCTATIADVVAYSAAHAADRAAARKRAIDLALEAAAERARMQRLLVPPSADSSSGLKNVADRLTDEMDAISNFTEPARASAQMTVAERAMASMPLSEHSSATLGSAALVAEMPGHARRWRAVAAIAGGVAVAAIVAVIALAARGGPTAGPSAATLASPAPPPSAPMTSASAPPPPPIAPAPVPSVAAAPAASASTPPPRGGVRSPAPKAPPPKPASTTRKGSDYGF